MISVESLSKSYGKNAVLHDVSLSVPDGAVTGLLGPNGAGKSTLMRCVLGLDRPSGGGATVDGEPFAAIANKPAAAGALLDAGWFVPSRSARSHLRVIARGAGIPDTRVDELLELVGLASVANKKVGAFSLGMKQRLGVATALLGDPQNLVFDEPVNGLDPEGVAWVRRTLKHLAAEGKAVLVSSHLLSEMQQTADRVVLLGRGRLLGEHEMAEFLSAGASVVVSSPSIAALVEHLEGKGLTVSGAPQGEGEDARSVAVPEGWAPERVRALVGETALEAGVAITELYTKQSSLEETYLSATEGAEEFQAAESREGRAS